MLSKLGRNGWAVGFSPLLAEPRLRTFCETAFQEELDADGSLCVPARLEPDAAGFDMCCEIATAGPIKCLRQ